MKEIESRYLPLTLSREGRGDLFPTTSEGIKLSLSFLGGAENNLILV